MFSFPTPKAHVGVEGVIRKVPEKAFPGGDGGSRNSTICVARAAVGASEITARAISARNETPNRGRCIDGSRTKLRTETLIC